MPQTLYASMHGHRKLQNASQRSSHREMIASLVKMEYVKLKMPLQRFVGCIALTLLCAAPLRAQQDRCVQRSIPVSVLTQSGKVVTGLDAANFQGSYRNKPVRIQSATMETQPSRIIFLLDGSGSMLDRDDRNLAAGAAALLLARMPPQTQVGLVVFSTTVDQAVGLTTDRTKVERGLEQHKNKPKPSPEEVLKTALWDAIQSALTMFGSPQQGDVIYVISDSEDNASRTRARELEEPLLASGVRVFSLVVRSFYDFEPEGLGLSGATALEQLTAVTGGTALVALRDVPGFDPNYAVADKSGRPTQLGRNVELQLWRMISFYRLQIELPRSVDKPREWNLKVRLSKHGKGNVEVAYPRKLASCGPSRQVVPAVP